MERMKRVLLLVWLSVSLGTGLGTLPNLFVVFDSVLVVRAGQPVDAASQSPTSSY